MFVLLLSAILVVVANGATSQNQVIARGWCRSSLNSATRNYNNVRCRIPNARADQNLHLSITNQRSPYTCTHGNNYRVVRIQDSMYISVTNGCYAYFVVSVTGNGAAWDEWSDWSTCSTDCRSTRSRNCSTGTDTDCSGELKESKACFTGECKSKVSNHEMCGKANPASGFRVVNGKTAGNCEYPWMVMVYNKVKKSLCGGSILDERHIVTAAHCVQDKTTKTNYPSSYFTIYSGSSKISSSSRTIQQHSVEKVNPHQNYVFNNYQIKDDIAVVRLSKGLKFDQCNRPICLADGTRSVQKGNNCRVMGWGRTSNDQNAISTPQDLQWISETAVSKSHCYSEYRSMVTDKVFCAKGERAGACSGDSGGPFTCQHEDGKFYHYGIVSAGKPGQCGERFTLYVNTQKYLDWINGVISS